jgi:hypothetical protein
MLKSGKVPKGNIMAENQYLKKNSDMVGTPRGYVKKKAIERVDREMEPILEKATTVLSFTPLGRAAAGTRAASSLFGHVPGVVRKFTPSGRAAARGEKAADAATRSKSKSGGSYNVKYTTKRTIQEPAKEAPKAAAKPRKSSSGTSYSSESLSRARSGPASRAPKKPQMSEAKRVGLAGGATAGIVGGYYGSQQFAAKKASAEKPRTFGGARSGERSGSRPAAKSSLVGLRALVGTRTPVGARAGETPGGYQKKAAQVLIQTPKAPPSSSSKSKTRIAFEKEFAKQRKSGAKTFTFQGKRYTTKVK